MMAPHLYIVFYLVRIRLISQPLDSLVRTIQRMFHILKAHTLVRHTLSHVLKLTSKYFSEGLPDGPVALCLVHAIE